MEENGSEFMKQFGGSAAANVVFAIGILVYKFIESRCKHSRCSSDTQCFKCSVDNLETERSKHNIAKDAVQSEESLPQMHQRNDQVVQEKHFAVEKLELRDPESISARERIVVISRENV